jgi:ketosteroid isomerase-like protein
MSRENVEIVRRMYDAYARGEYELFLSHMDPGIEFSTPADEPGGGTYQGRQGVIEAHERWTAPWDDFRFEVEELTDFGDQVLARARNRGRGKSSGIEVEGVVFQLWTIRNEKMVRVRMYSDEREALEAAACGK